MTTKLMSFKMPENMLDELELVAVKEERSKAFLIRKAIEKYLKEKENAKK